MIEWLSNFSVNNQEIDKQHTELFQIMFEIEEAVNNKDIDYVNLVNVVNRMEHYVNKHFDYEEQLMIKYNYPQISEHIRAHNAFRDKIRNTYVFDIQKPLDFYHEMAEYLMQWLKSHILKVDMVLGKYLLEYQ